MSLQLKRKPKEQYELFKRFEIVGQNGTAWRCNCGTVHNGLFHCARCKAEPPGGCKCVYCVDPVTLWEQ